jgi:predicted nucleic acid-binding protein
MVVFDTAVLLLLMDPNARSDVDQGAKRVEHLIKTLAVDKELIVVPTPVLSEILVRAGAAMQGYLDILNGSAAFRIVPFDQKAAIECALAIRDSLDRGGVHVDSGDPDVSRSKVKFDRQIVAIAKAEGAHTVYTNDDDVVRYAHQAELKARRPADLDLPPEDPQQSLDLE